MIRANRHPWPGVVAALFVLVGVQGNKAMLAGYTLMNGIVIFHEKTLGLGATHRARHRDNSDLRKLVGASKVSNVGWVATR